jgi:hypothetical protein
MILFLRSTQRKERRIIPSTDSIWTRLEKCLERNFENEETLRLFRISKKVLRNIIFGGPLALPHAPLVLRTTDVNLVYF